MDGGAYAGGGIGRRAGSKRGVHNGLQLMGNANMTAECAMCGANPHPEINTQERNGKWKRKQLQQKSF